MRGKVTIGFAVAVACAACSGGTNTPGKSSMSTVLGPSGAGGSGSLAPKGSSPGLNNSGLPGSTIMGAAGVAGGAVLPQAGAGGAAGGTALGTGGGSVPMGGAGMGAMPAGGGVPPASGGTDPVIPAVNGNCPTIATGQVAVMGATVSVWTGSGTQPGPLMIYWHGTGGAAATATAELDPTLVSEIMATGGAIISMESGGQGNPIDWGVFTLGDYAIVDQLVACSVKQLHVDTRRIYTGGASAGGLAAGTMAFARSSYLAASNPNSGGVAPWPGLATFQDPSHIPAIMTMHGGSADMVVISFGQASLDLDNATAAAGGFAVDCNHGGGHVAAPPDLKAAGWVFMKAHPFGTKPSPYEGGLPAGFPSYCMTIKK
jgi:hypothetical protein